MQDASNPHTSSLAHEPTREVPVTIRIEQGIVIITFMRDILSQQMIDDTSALLRQQLEKAPLPLKAIMDFSNIRHAGSNFLGMVMESALKITHRKGRLIVCSMSPEIADLFELTRLDKIVATQPVKDQAIAALNKPDSTTNTP